MMHRSSPFLLIGWCLLSAWLLYGGLELAEELKLVVKVQASARDLDMEALVQLASGLKPDVPTLENPPGSPNIPRAIETSQLMPSHQIYGKDRHPVWTSSSLRLHQSLSVYRI